MYIAINIGPSANTDQRGREGDEWTVVDEEWCCIEIGRYWWLVACCCEEKVSVMLWSMRGG